MTYSVPEHPLPDWLAQLVSPLDDKLGVKVREISP
ncbi:PaaI family thioesterase, partial [Xanthomonas citri pv. citri]|nr:PaaI family thioesterase [Xanthomonas citri pv. citri]